MEYSKQIAKHLLHINAVKLSPQAPFTWASGIKSPIYCDNRIVLSHPDIRTTVIEAFAALSTSFEPFDVVAGVATAGIAHGALLAHILKKPFIYVRSKPKGHGRQNQIEGELKSGSTVLVIEDLISTGGSSLQAVEVLRAAQAKVVGVAAIFSYEFEAAKLAFEAANCPFQTLSNYTTLLEQAVEDTYILPSDLETLQTWRANPKAWRK